MAINFWAIGEATKHKTPTGEPVPIDYLAGLVTWMLAAGVFVGFKMASAELPPWMYCCIRAGLSALVLLPLVATHHREMGKFLRKRGLEVFCIGAIGLGLTQGVAFTALEHTTAVNFGIIMAVSPIITMVLAYFVLNEPMNTWQSLGSIIAFAGIVSIAVQGSVDKLIGIDLSFGDMIALGAALLFATYTVLIKRAKFELDRMPLLVLLLSCGAIASSPFFALEIWNGDHVDVAMSGYLALLYAVIPGGALMYMLFNRSIEVLGATRASALFYTQMIFTAILAWLMLGESIEWYHFFGAVLIIIGVILVTYLKPKAVPKASA